VISIISALGLILGLPTTSSAAQPLASAGWHGRAVELPRSSAPTVTQASFPRGWSAGAVRLGTGFRHAGGSERVREVQKRLWQLGYQPGPVDGLFGPRTQAAVQWFQIKHGFRPNGVVDLRTLSHLRERTGATPAATPTGDRSGRPQPASAAQPQAAPPLASRPPAAVPQAAPPQAAPPQAAPPQAAVPQAAPPHAAVPSPAPAGKSSSTKIFALVLLLAAIPVLLALTALWRRKTPKQRQAATNGKVVARRPATKGKVVVHEPATNEKVVPRAPAPHPVTDGNGHPGPLPHPVTNGSGHPAPLLTIGYVRPADPAELARQAAAIREACARRDWKLADVVRDPPAGGDKRPNPPGLVKALERLSASGRSRLVVSRLSDLSRSPSELMRLLRWLSRHNIAVIALDAKIDTSTPGGRRAAHGLLAAVARRQAQARASAHRNGTHPKAMIAATAEADPADGGDSS
jgi:peptidoglycan hydrolase-like protein with peptidoglycan-binding domain